MPSARPCPLPVCMHVRRRGYKYAHASVPCGKITTRARVVLMKNDIHAALPSSIVYFRIPRMLKNSHVSPMSLVNNAENPACVFIDKQPT